MADTHIAKDGLADRCKDYELAEADRRAMRGLPLLARLDGRAFHTFTRDLKRPYEHGMSVAMIETTRYLVHDMNALVGYKLKAVFGGHSAYGGHRAPRDHTVSFRLQDERGQFRSNVIWLLPEQLRELTPENIRRLVERSNGKLGKLR